MQCGVLMAKLAQQVLTDSPSREDKPKGQAPPLGRVHICQDRLHAREHQSQTHSVQAGKRCSLRQELTCLRCIIH